MQYAKDGLPEGREFGRPEEVLSVDPNGSNVTPIRSLSNERDQFPCPNQYRFSLTARHSRPQLIHRASNETCARMSFRDSIDC